MREAGLYISKLPKSEHEHKAWQTAMHCLIEAAEKRGPISFARMGMLQAIYKDDGPLFGPGKRVAKDPHWGRRKLARDR